MLGNYDAILLTWTIFNGIVGAIGGPKWGVNLKVRPEQGLLSLRKALGLYANIRPANFASESLLSHSPLKPNVAQGVDMIVIRELIGGAYFGERKELGASPSEDSAWDTMIYSIPEVQRITRVAAQVALSANPPLPIHSIDKANVLASSRLWRKVATETLQNEFPQLKLDHHLVDSASMLIVSNPRKLNGVILTENLFGDMYVSPTFFWRPCLNLFLSACPTSQVSSQVPWDSSRPPPSRAHHLSRTIPPPLSNPPPVCTSPSTAQHRTLRVKALQTLLAPSSVRQCFCDTLSAWRSPRRRSKKPYEKSWTTRKLEAKVCAPQTSVDRTRPRTLVTRLWRS